MSKLSLNQIFVNRLKEYLGNRTAYWLSKESGVSNASISRILAGKMNPTLDVVEQIAAGVNAKPHELLQDFGSKNPSIPPDIESMLSNQDEMIYEAIRGMLKPILERQKR